jgi:glucose/arabinose dehydrogenase
MANRTRMTEWRHASFLLVAVSISAVAVVAQRHDDLATHLPRPFATPSAMKFPTVVGWSGALKPTAPDGFVVDAVAELESPRWLYVLPNNDVLVAQARTERVAGLKPEQEEALRKAGSLGPSPNQITLLRDADKDGQFELKTVLLKGLNQPFGMVMSNGQLYVANTDGVVRYPYSVGETAILAAPTKVVDLPAGGYNNHWTRNIVASPSGDAMYVSVGSQTNADEEGLDAKQPHRAAILRMKPDGSALRVFASGLRNPNGMDWAPGSETLWTVVNERDLLGDNLVPDFLTSVRDGAFYGWPYSYFGTHEDPRQKGKRPDLVTKAVVPDMAVGAHTASLGLLFYRGTSFPARFHGGAFIGQHGSWNRSTFSGYAVTFVPFASGRPSGPMQDFLTGFIASEERSEVRGRPVGLAMLADGSLLVADDAGNRVWRVRHARQPASATAGKRTTE